MGYGSLIPDEIRFFLLTTSFKWLPRNGIATPAQIVYAVQEGVTLVLFVSKNNFEDFL
jgi:hypothetical protein